MSPTRDRKHKKKNTLFTFALFLCTVLLLAESFVLIPRFTDLSHFLLNKKSDHRVLAKEVSERKFSPQTLELIPPTAINDAPEIDQYLTKIGFNGSALMIKDQKIMLNKGYGYANFEKKIPNQANNYYFIGSISKVFVSTSIMQLQELGKVNVSDPLSKYIPTFPNGKAIKLFNLLTHTSGIPEHSQTSEQITHEELMKKISQGTLLFQPGTKWNYSDSNYSILAYIVEQVSGEPYEQYVKKHIFDKAHMNYTGFGKDFSNPEQLSIGYKYKQNQLIMSTIPNMSQLYGCGDIYSTPFDMYLFDKALFSGKLISKESLKTFFTPFKRDYAFGMYSNPGSYSNHGVLSGYNCLNSFSKQGNKYVILFSNIKNGVESLGEVNNQIYMMTNS